MDFEVRVKDWRTRLNMPPLDNRQIQRLSQPEARAIVEHMMKHIRPTSEVQMIRRNLAISKFRKTCDAADINMLSGQQNNEKLCALHKRLRSLEEKVKKKASQEAAQHEKIDSLKVEVKQLCRKESNLQQQIFGLQQLAVAVKLGTEHLLKNSQQQCDNLFLSMDNKNVKQDSQCVSSEVSSPIGVFIERQGRGFLDLMTPDGSAPPVHATNMPLHYEQVEAGVHKAVLQKQFQHYKSQIEAAIDGLTDSVVSCLGNEVDKEMVREWAVCQVEQKKSEVLQTSLEESLAVRDTSLKSDRSYLRLLLLNAEKQLENLGEHYKNSQKELIQLTKELSQSWQNIEETAQRTRNKRLELAEICEKSQICFAELTNEWKSIVSLELEKIHETMVPSIMRNSAQQILDFGIIYNDIFYILNVVAQKRLARRVVFYSPKVLSLTEGHQIEEIIKMNSSEWCKSEEYKKSHKMNEWHQHMKSSLSDNNQLLQSLKDYLSVWWQPTFEQGVPEDLIVNGKNILQHTTNWDRVTNFLRDEQLKKMILGQQE